MIPDTFLISDSSLPQGQYISLLNLSCGIGILSSAGSLSSSTARRCTRKLEISTMDFSGCSRCSISSVSTATYSPPSTSSYSGVSKRNSSGPFVEPWKERVVAWNTWPSSKLPCRIKIQPCTCLGTRFASCTIVRRPTNTTFFDA